MKTIEIKKLDGRYTGSRDFQYLAKPTTFMRGPLTGLYQTNKVRYETFQDLRIWCWNTWGPSCEYRFWSSLPDDKKNKHWAWDTENHKMRIYIASDKEAAWMRIKWE